MKVFDALRYLGIVAEILTKVEALTRGEVVDAVVKFSYRGKAVRLDVKVS